MDIDPERLQEISAMASREADAGAPGGMVAVYVHLALLHLALTHDGPWHECTDCHRSLGMEGNPFEGL